MWVRTTMADKLLDPDDPVEAWRQRMFNLFDGFARRATAVETD